ncbi:MAG: hypothetical protein GXO10_06765 [Crenarchaeota archaeon]|nr:hypothetical protein [Thermoproteota archaeon]
MNRKSFLNNAVLVEGKNDKYLAYRYIYHKLLEKNMKLRVRELSGKSNILKLYHESKIRECIIIIDYDSEENLAWPSRCRNLLDKLKPLSNDRDLTDILYHVDNEKKCLFIVIRKNLEYWIGKVCNLDPKFLKRNFEKLCNSNECVSNLLGKLSNVIVDMYLSVVSR